MENSGKTLMHIYGTYLSTWYEVFTGKAKFIY